MFFQQVVHSDLGCASYVIGAGNGEAMVVDPRWEVEEYTKIAEDHHLRITRIVETHTHADHVSGHPQLSRETGATVYIHEAAKVEYPHTPVVDGDVIGMNDVRVHVIHTPGHRPEHIALAIEDTSRGCDPWIVLTGDSLFIGDVARPDLAVDGREGANHLYESLHGKLLKLPEFAAVYPAHVAGSLCGRVTSEVYSTTIGYEMRYNDAVRIDSRDAFVEYMNANLPQRPPNMARIVRENQTASAPMAMELSHLESEFDAVLQECTPLDVRPTSEYLRAHIRRSLHVPVSGPQFGTRAGFVLSSTEPIVLIASDEIEARRAETSLHVVAFHNLRGWMSVEDWYAQTERLATIAEAEPGEISDLGDGVTVLDVREADEWATGIAPNALRVPYREIGARVAEIPSDKPVAVTCQSGGRSAIAASVLERSGFDTIVNVRGGMSAWNEAHLPTVLAEPALTS